jgi:hypothetical protein
LELTYSVPQYWLIACLAGGVAVAAAHYFWKSPFRERHPRWNAVLAVFRGLVAALIIFLLLGPMARLSQKESEAPSLLLMADNSRSMLVHGDSAQLRKLLNERFQRLRERAPNNTQPVAFHFADALNRETDSLDFSGRSTNLAGAISEAADLYYGRNVGAMVVLSDGIYNEGIQPESAAERTPFPIYTIGVGDTVPPADLRIEDVLHNQIAYQGNAFPVRVLVRAKGLVGQECRVRLRKDGQTLATQRKSIRQDAFFHTFRFQPKAQGQGLQRYQVDIAPLEKEFSEENNRQAFYIEVLESRRKVVMLARAPHPDIGALKRALENEQFSMEVFTMEDYQQKEELFQEALRDAEVLLLHDLPTARQSLANLRESAGEQELPVWAIAGSATDLNQLAAWQLGFSPEGARRGEVQATAVPEDNFSLFSIPKSQLEVFERLPPLKTPYLKINTNRGGETLFRQKVGAVASEKPLMFFQTGRRKTVVLLGTGLWRWSVFSYVLEETHEPFRQWVSKTIRYLASRDDKRLFRLVELPPFFPENEEVVLRAELYNPSYELLEGGSATLELTDPQGKAYTYNFVESGRFYEARLGRLKPGVYSFKAKTTIAGEQRTISGQFLVKEQSKELTQPVARYDVLRRISGATGGAFLSIDSLDRLPQMLQARNDIKPLSYMRTSFRELIREPLFLAVLVLLLSLEWGLRKYFGQL